jgi:serine/threonine-protein kinase
LSPTLAESDPPTALVRRDSFVELPPGSIVGDTYEIDAKLGAGAMGEVYAARHMKLGKRVAIKVIRSRLSEDDAAIERFAMEARTLAQIQHPAIVAVEHVGELADGRAYFVMEYLRGESLLERLARGRIPLAEALRILDQMARGLEAAHAQGVIHRDLKPENTFLVHMPGEPPIVKLVDFGLAKLAADVDNVDRRAERTQSGVAIGTPMYMSPEQARGPDVDQRSDVYALGCVAYELLLGSTPFPHARTAPELYAAHLHESPPLPRSIWPEIPPQLDLALFAMLAKDPAHRPTLAQVRAVITTVRTSTPSQRAATEFVAPLAPKKSRKTIFTVVIAVSLLVVGILVEVLLLATSSKEAPHAVPTVAPIPAPRVTSPQVPPQQLVPPPSAQPAIQTSVQPPRNTSVPAKRPRIEQPARVGSAIDAGVEVTASDATVDTREAAPPPTAPVVVPEKKPVDRNQTVNPFAAKHRKVKL